MKVVIIMGSVSDEPHSLKITKKLDEYGVKWEQHAASAHKEPRKVLEILDNNLPIRCFHIRAHLFCPNPHQAMFDMIEVIHDFKEKGYEAYLSRQRENFGCDMFFLKN